MGTPGRNAQSSTIFSAELDPHPAKEGRRAMSKVYDDVVDRPRPAPDELGLLRRLNLVVHATQGASFGVVRQVPLRKPMVQPLGRELLFAERSREESPVVDKDLEVDDLHALQRGLGELHRRTVAADPDDRSRMYVRT